MQKLAGSAATEISAHGGELRIIPMATFEELFELSDSPEVVPAVQKIGLDEPAVILHSSGIILPIFLRILTNGFRRVDSVS
jgi:hypothetical protein